MSCTLIAPLIADSPAFEVDGLNYDCSLRPFSYRSRMDIGRGCYRLSPLYPPQGPFDAGVALEAGDVTPDVPFKYIVCGRQPHLNTSLCPSCSVRSR